jgi:acyl carrier protein
MRAQRDEVAVLTADLNDGAQVKAAVDAGFERFGRIDMVVHGAARIDAGAFGAVAETDWRVVEAQFSPKLRGLWHLMEAMRGREPRRWILHSSISSVLGGLALGAYSAVNAVLDALAIERGPDWLSIDWDAWDNAAEAQSASLPSAIQPPEGSEAMLRLLGSWEGSRALVAINLEERLKAWVHHAGPTSQKTATDRHPRPSLATTFVEPRTETERRLAEIWASQLGLEAVGIHDRFFDLGGHSLLAAQIASEICDRFEIELPVLELFRAPTVAELSVLVEKANSRKSGVRTPDEAPAPVEAVAQPELEGSGVGVVRTRQNCDCRGIEPEIDYVGDLCRGVQRLGADRELKIILAGRRLGMESHAGGEARLLAAVQARIKRNFFQGQIRGAPQFLSADRDGSNLLLIGAGVDERNRARHIGRRAGEVHAGALGSGQVQSLLFRRERVRVGAHELSDLSSIQTFRAF